MIGIDDKNFRLRFLRRRDTHFVFPVVVDEMIINRKDIVKVLELSDVARGKHTFRGHTSIRNLR